MIILIDQPLTNDHQDQGPTGPRSPTRPDLANSKPACLAPAGGVEACDTAKSKAHPGEHFFPTNEEILHRNALS